MSDMVAVGALSAGALLNARADKVIAQSGSASSENHKIDQSAKDFEAILLGTWLQQAEQSFGSLPGGDEEGDADVGKEQFMSIAMQSLGTAMTASGGIGLAKMIASQLHRSEDARVSGTKETAQAK